MGACVSTHQKASSAVKSFGSNDQKLAIPPSPTKDKPLIINGDFAVKTQWPPSQSTVNFRDFGSKEETFFDSQAWLESDCEDDFRSVNGEFTPSRGNTPVHHNFSARANGGSAFVDNKKPNVSSPDLSPSPTQKKTRLSDLFKESLRAEHLENTESADENRTNESPLTAVVHGGETAANGGGLKPKREKWVRSVQGCFPSLTSSGSPSTNRRLKKMSSTTSPSVVMVN